MTPEERAEKIWCSGAPYFGARDKGREVERIAAEIRAAEKESFREACAQSYEDAAKIVDALWEDNRDFPPRVGRLMRMAIEKIRARAQELTKTNEPKN